MTPEQAAAIRAIDDLCDWVFESDADDVARRIYAAEAERDQLRAQAAAVEEYAEKRQRWPRFAPFADEIFALVGRKPRD